MSPLPTRAELALRYRAFERAEGHRGRIATVLFMAALFGNLPLRGWAEWYGAGWVMIPAFIAELAAMLAFGARVKQRAREAEVSCPACGAAFISQEARQLAVATGNCGECAAPVARDVSEVRDDFAPTITSPRAKPPAAMRWGLLVLVLGGLVAYSVTAKGKGRQRRIVPAVGVTVEQAAARIAATRGRPSVVLLYGTRCRPTCRVLADFAAMARRHPDVDIQAFSTDELHADELPVLLWQHDANFAPMFLRAWPAGALDRAMAPLGIKIGTTWRPHLVAVRDAEGRVVTQGQAVQDVAPFERALEQLR